MTQSTASPSAQAYLRSLKQVRIVSFVDAPASALAHIDADPLGRMASAM